jgi:prepilin-type N-terminal cleavage/methylation domain-containing protein
MRIPKKGMDSRVRGRGRGFSLIELLIVIAIILVIAAIAIPRFMRSKMLANESAAVAALRTIATVQVSYDSTFKQGFAPNLAALGPPPTGTIPGPAAAGLIDQVLASGTKGGYVFVYAAVDADGNGQPEAYTCNANPSSVGQTGEKFFFVDQTNVVRWSTGSAAGPTSTPVPP